MIRSRLSRARHIRFLRAVGASDVEHSDRDLLQHLVAVADLLRSWGARPALCDAALFHSVYGTEFLGAGVVGIDQRDRIRAQIGGEAERIAWLWHSIRRASLVDLVTGTTPDRKVELTEGGAVELSTSDVADLVDLWVADAVEQLPHRGPEALERQRGWLGPLLPLALPAGAAAVRGLLFPPDEQR